MDKVYLAAISGGADSMALLDMAYKAGLNIVAVHVNYQKRQSAWRDQKIVADYCLKHDIPLYVNYAASLNGKGQKEPLVFDRSDRALEWLLKLQKDRKAEIYIVGSLYLAGEIVRYAEEKREVYYD